MDILIRDVKKKIAKLLPLRDFVAQSDPINRLERICTTIFMKTKTDDHLRGIFPGAKNVVYILAKVTINFR